MTLYEFSVSVSPGASPDDLDRAGGRACHSYRLYRPVRVFGLPLRRGFYPHDCRTLEWTAPVIVSGADLDVVIACRESRYRVRGRISRRVCVFRRCQCWPRSMSETGPPGPTSPCTNSSCRYRRALPRRPGSSPGEGLVTPIVGIALPVSSAYATWRPYPSPAIASNTAAESPRNLLVHIAAIP